MSNGDWVPCEGYGQVFEWTAGVEGNLVLVSTGEFLGTIRSDANESARVGVMDVRDDLIVERIVGHVYIRTTVRVDQGNGVFAERIRKGMLDDDGLIATFAEDFSDAGEANEAFLWQRASPRR